jgi:hypothetical protein
MLAAEKNTMQSSNHDAGNPRPPGRHLYFDDRAAVLWHSRLAPALTQAADEGKRVLIVVGRRDCGGTRALIEKIFPKQEITEELRAGFVAVCSDTGAIEDAVVALMQQAPRKEPTPLCLYTDASGRLLHSTVGGRPAAVFLRDLTEAHARR